MTQIALPSELVADDKKPWNRSVIAAAAIILGFAVLLGVYFSPAISEPDDNGYFAQGTLLAQTGHTMFDRQSDAQYIGMHWLLTPDGHFISRYPPGLAALIAVVYKAFGFKATMLINPAFGIITLAATFLLARRIVSPMWAIAAIIALATNPQFIHRSLAGDSHIGVAACLTVGLALLVAWWQDGKLWQIFLAGIALGCIPTIRYPDSIVAAGIAIFIIWIAFTRERAERFATRTPRRAPLHILIAIAGASVPVIPLLIRNQLALGAFWKTGYALTNEQTGFSFEYFKEHAIDYIKTIHSGGLGMFFAIGVVGFVAMIGSKKFRPLGVLLAMTTIPMLMLYMAYYWAPVMNASATMRFLVPTFPVYVVAGVWMLGELTRGVPTATRVAMISALLGLQLLWGTADAVDEARRLHDTRRSLSIVTDALRDNTQANDLVIANSGVLQHLDFVRDWKLADASLAGMGGGGMFGGGGNRGGRFGMNGGGPGMGGPGGNMGAPGGGMGGPPGIGGPDDNNNNDAPSPQQSAKREEQRSLYTGTTREKQKKFLADITTWAGDGRILYVGTEHEMRNVLTDAKAGSWNILTHVALPQEPVEETNRGNARGGFGGRGMGGPGGPGGMGGRGMGGGGPPGMNALAGEKEVVIAQWVTK